MDGLNGFKVTRWFFPFPFFFLQVEFTPNSIHKFDTYIQVNVRGSKTVSLRVGGTIEPPCVDIDVVSRSGLQSFFVNLCLR